MLSPVDFIFNDYLEPPYYLEVQHFVNPDAILTNSYLEPVSKIFNPYSTNDEPKAIDLTPTQIAEIYYDYLNSHSSKKNSFVENSPYFPGVRFISSGIVVFERPPTYQIIDIDNDYRESINDETSSSQYYVPIPWQVYVCIYNPEDMRLNSVKMFFAKSYLSDIDQEVFCPPMFNFYSNGSLCRPFFPSMDDIEKYSQDINGVIASAYDWVWNSGFNFDITENIAQFLSSKKFEEFAPWAESKAPKSIQYLRDHTIYGLPRITHRSYIESFFRCWESVPLEEVSSIQWSNYTDAEFYYQEINNLSSNFLYEYISSNNILICEDYDEDIDEDYEHECEDCMTEDAVRESDDYQQAYLKATLIPSKTIKNAIEQSVKYATSQNLIVKTLNSVQFSRSFINIYQKYLPQG